MTTDPQRPEVDDPRVLALAKARQHRAHSSPFNFVCPPWDGLTEQEQHLSLLDARNYLHAAIDAGLVAAGPVAVPPTTSAHRDRAAAVAEDLRYILGYGGPGHAHEKPGVWDTSGKPCGHCARLAAARANLAAYDADSGAVLPSPVDRAAVYAETADTAEDIAGRLHREGAVERSQGAYDVMDVLRKASRDEAQEQPAAAPVHIGGRANAEDCPACSGTNPPYPFVCPGPADGSRS